MAGKLIQWVSSVVQSTPQTPVPFHPDGFKEVTSWAFLPGVIPPTSQLEFEERVYGPYVQTPSSSVRHRPDCLEHAYYHWLGEFPVRTQDVTLQRILWCLHEFLTQYRRAYEYEEKKLRREALPCYQKAYVALQRNLELGATWPKRSKDLLDGLYRNMHKTKKELESSQPPYKLHWLMLPETCNIMLLVLQAELTRCYYACLKEEDPTEYKSGVVVSSMRIENRLQKAVDHNLYCGRLCTKRRTDANTPLLNLKSIEMLLPIQHTYTLFWLSKFYSEYTLKIGKADTTASDADYLAKEAAKHARQQKHSLLDKILAHEKAMEKQLNDSIISSSYTPPRTLDELQSPFNLDSVADETILTAVFAVPNVLAS